MKTFKGFTPDQQYKLLQRMGYEGPADQDTMDSFLAASPSAAARMGKYAQVAQQRVSGKALGGTAQMANGGYVPPPGAGQEAVAKGIAFADRLEKNPTKVLDNARSGITTNTAIIDNLTKELENYEAGTPEYQDVQDRLTYRQDQLSNWQNKLSQAQAASASNYVNTSKDVLSDSSSYVTTPESSDIATKGTTIDKGTGKVNVTSGQVNKTATVGNTATASKPKALDANTVKAKTVSDDINRVAKNTKAAQGSVSRTVTPAQGTVSSKSLATAAKFDKDYLDLVEAGQLEVDPNQLASAAGLDADAAAAKIAKSTGIDPVIAQQGTVSAEELPEAATIAENDMAQATAISSGGVLSQDATAVAAKLDSFTVDNGTLAAAVQGDVNAQDTVQGQLSSLMQQFNDGTPSWAAGAIRAANAAMGSRGLGGSSMAGAAIYQAAMESALPIAQQDAQVFANMNLTNVNNAQQVALANAAAQQGLELANLSNEQQASLQNSMNSFNLQSQDLSAQQQVILANAQIKASLQAQNLSNQQQSNLATAARYAEVANMNLNNKQQSALQNNANNLKVDLANLSNKQQSYITNAQLEASLQGKQIDNQQQTAIFNAARYAEAANITFTAEQQAQIHNSELMKSIGLAELNAEQAATLQNAATYAAMDMANLNNRQQAQVANAQNFLQMDLANLSNQQQTTIFKSQARIDGMLSDQAAVNAAKQFNAASENQTDQFFADLKANVNKFNVEQKNATKQFNVSEVNAVKKFNKEVQNSRAQFNATNQLVIAQANAQWKQNIAVTEFEAEHEINMETAKTANSLTTQALDAIWQQERDIMSYAFQSGENAADRDLSILMGDKTIAAEKSSAKSSALGGLAAEFLFGSGPLSLGSLF